MSDLLSELIPGADGVQENLLRAWCGPLRAEMTFRDLLVTTGMDSEAVAASLVRQPRWTRARFCWQRRCLVYRPGEELLRQLGWCLLSPFTADEWEQEEAARMDARDGGAVSLTPYLGSKIIPITSASA